MAADRTDRPAAGTGAADPAVEVRRSPRRRRTVSAYREGDRTVVLIPAQMSAGEEERWVRAMLDRLERRERRSALNEPELARRALALSAQYLGGRARPVSVRWVGNQAARWGSCTPVDGTIRISDRVRGLPEYVLDYVLLHELAHLLVPNHGPNFWALLEAYPRTERARGYLEGYARSDGSADHDQDDDAKGADEAEVED
jgi:predicted metal-dependent hydrolase